MFCFLFFKYTYLLILSMIQFVKLCSLLLLAFLLVSVKIRQVKIVNRIDVFSQSLEFFNQVKNRLLIPLHTNRIVCHLIQTIRQFFIVELI